MTTSGAVGRQPGQSRSLAPDAAGQAPDVATPTAIAVDLGSGFTRVWSSGRPLLNAPTFGSDLAYPAGLVRRGRIVDPDGCQALLTRLQHRLSRPVPAGALVVACRPVLATADDERTTRHVLTAAFNPSRLVFIDTVRAAAIGGRAASGAVLVADVGAQLTEVAVLADGAVVAARRAEIGMCDLVVPTESDAIASAVVDLVTAVRRQPDAEGLATSALLRGLLLVGGGATQPQLVARIAAGLKAAVRPAVSPRVVAVRGAAVAALSTLRHTAASRTT